MHILIAIAALVILFPLPLLSQDTGETEKAFGKEERVVEPVKKEKRLMDLTGGKSEDTNETVDEKTPTVRRRIPVTEGATVDKPAKQEKDLPYLDEDQDE